MKILAPIALSIFLLVQPALADKVLAARRAFAQRDGDALGVYALYSASVAAYDAEAYDTAIELASLAEPLAGPDVAPSVREVLAAARAELRGGATP